MKKLNLEILTPFGKYYAGEVDAIKVHSDDFYMEILPNHSPLVSSLAISKMTMKDGGKETVFAIGGGIIRVEKGKTTLLLNSIEGKNDIDINRANEAKTRAEQRLANKDNIDVARATRALKRALTRIDVYNS
ncbi:MAG: ATP synthase F1 subunit epsilon [Bacilli bacterium]|nr:ATP synthase F1 subunit epsilon [Bacilli bacterium]